MKKNLIVTITVVTAISLGILTGCGSTTTNNTDPLTQPATQIEQMIETEETSETSETTQTQNPSTEQQHTHTWVTETRYRTVHHDAVTHVVHHDAVTHTVHHDAVTHTETQTTYTTETQTIHHDGCYTCRGCGATFGTEAEANAHCDNSSNVNCIMGGWSGSPGWDETVTVQVPHTETVTIVDQAAWDETVIDQAAWDETVVDQEAYDEQVPYTVTVCSECGAVK